MSTLSREIQEQEVLFLINSNSFLEPNEKQSVRDRIASDLSHINSYYIEKVEKGSLTLTISLTAFAIWLLQNTIGESIKDAWKKTQFHQYIIDYLTSERRADILNKNADIFLDSWMLERFLVDGRERTTDQQGNVTLKISLKTLESIEEHIRQHEERVDVDFVIESSKRFLLEQKKLSSTRKHKEKRKLSKKRRK